LSSLRRPSLIPHVVWTGPDYPVHRLRAAPGELLRIWESASAVVIDGQRRGTAFFLCCAID
jgi:hypothetical protein